MARTKALVVALLVVCGACKDSKNGDGATGAVSYAKVNLTAPSAGSASSPSGQRSNMVCRIISVAGPMSRDGDAGVANNDTMGDSWIDLKAGAKLGIKNGTTTREMLVDGPGAVRACVGDEEEVWMPSGVFASVTGAGESPGAEVWVVTPHAVVRYGSGAHVTLTSGVPRLDVKLDSGSAWAYPIDATLMHDAGAPKVVDGWTEIPANANISFVSKKAPSQVLGDCEQAAKTARDLGAAIVSHDASLAETAPQHVVARHKARAVCAVAELLATRSLDNLERERLLPRARAANAKWREM